MISPKCELCSVVASALHRERWNVHHVWVECPAFPLTSPAWELAEAADLLEDGMTTARGGSRVEWYPTPEDAARFRAALAKWRAR